MCDRIIMPDGTEIESIKGEDECLCGNSQREILIWIVEHLPVLEFDDVVSINRDVFGYFVSIKNKNNNSKNLLHGSAISNAKQHSSHDRISHKFVSKNEGKNEEMRGIIAPALQ